jgi:hypothetical protein
LHVASIALLALLTMIAGGPILLVIDPAGAGQPQVRYLADTFVNRCAGDA